ncbi:nuclear transport factor 2 family protein [Desertivirga xinjiangensis]|uniref:nuclear transport factor 2 family protein n=1 Tax=Desertivirga xinjiangensis TaxID=539206 RepID=UPI00210CBDC6|nr:nuclear transport factor 2 family protein [Pedobacter xinjiangensis]
MKTLRSLGTLVLIVFTLSAFASDEAATEKLSMNHAVKTYLDAVSLGKLKGLAQVLDPEIKFTSTRGQRIIRHGKIEMLSIFKHNENIQQNCIADYTIMESNPRQAVVKVTMKYENFSKVEFLNIVYTSRGWKITDVSSTFI